MPNLIQYYDAKYVGGHVEYPKSLNCRLNVFYDRIELENPNLVIPYSSMYKIENMDDKKISALRVVGLGLISEALAIVGALWKKNHVYTVIHYKDQVDERIIILDLDENVEDLQRWIYHRMLSFRESRALVYAEKNFLLYENERYGFRMKYPDAWIEDELNENKGDYSTVVEFRRFIENRAPFVTVYVNNLGSRYKSFADFADEQIEDIKSDSSTTIVEKSNIVIGNNPGMKLVDVDKKGDCDEHDVYKRMIVWIFKKDKVYEISYSTKEDEYNKYLPIVEQMVNSFQPIQFATETAPEGLENLKSKETEDPLMILKRRFARGEITEEEYKKMRRLIDT